MIRLIFLNFVNIRRRRFSLHVNSLLVSVKGGIREALAAVLSEELAVTQPDVVDLVARAAAVHALPLLRRLLSFSGSSRQKHKQTWGQVNGQSDTFSTRINPPLQITYYYCLQKSPQPRPSPANHSNC